MLADEPTPKIKAAEQVLGVLRTHQVFDEWTLEDICVALLVEANRQPPTLCRQMVESRLRNLATILVDVFKIEV